MKPYRIIKPVAQTEDGIVIINNTIPEFTNTEFNVNDLLPLHVPIEYEGESFSSCVLLFNGDYSEVVPVNAIYNPDIEGRLEVLSLLINNNL